MQLISREELPRVYVLGTSKFELRHPKFKNRDMDNRQHSIFLHGENRIERVFRYTYS